MLSIRRKKYLLDCYSNISDLYNDISKKPRRDEADKESEDNGYGFTGTNSLKEAYNLLIRGDEKLYYEIKDTIRKLKIEKILGNVLKRNSNFNDIVGFQPNVPNYLVGIPQNMINIKQNKKSQKIVNIIINVTVSCGIDKDEYKKAGAYYFTIIDLLEKMGYRCNVYIAICEESQDNIFLLLKGKTDREPFNKEKMAFLLAHPSYFRRVGFKWIESCNCYGEPTHDGYGRPITDNNKIKKIIDKELKSDFIVWSIQEDYRVNIEDLLKRLKKSGIDIEIGD